MIATSKGMMASNELDSMHAEIQVLERWYRDLSSFVESGLKDPGVSKEEFANATAMISRVLMRLKALHSQMPQA